MSSAAAGGATVICGAAARDGGGELGLGILPLRPPPSSPSPSAIMIYLTAPGQAAMPMRVLASDSVASVKLRVHTSRGVTPRKQKLVFRGRELARDDGRIRDYGVAHGNVVHLVVRVPDLRLITVVETARGATFSFRVEPGRTVGYVKRQIANDHPAARPGPGPDQQRLLLHGEVLDDRHLIHDVCGADGAVIHLLVQRSSSKVVVSDDDDGQDGFQVSIVARDAGQPLPFPRRDVGIEPIMSSELLPTVRDMIDAAVAGMESGKAPIMSSEGTGGAYFMQDATGQRHVAVFKPADEEPMAANNPRGLPVSFTGEGLKKGTRVGEGALREVAAYILDHPSAAAGTPAGFAGVPPTALVRCTNRAFRHPPPPDQAVSPPPPVLPKLGSLQAFVSNSGSCEDMGPRAFPVHEVHKICVLDIRLANADRHAGNILVCKHDGDGGGMSLVPIDHGYCLPESFEDCTFEWLYWPQCREPFGGETVEYVRSLDAEEDMAVLRRHGWEVSRECARTLRVSTMLLKKGVERGLTAFAIGSFMCRETLTEESAIEEVVREAAEGQRGGGGCDEDDETAFLQAVSEVMDRRLDEISMSPAGAKVI